MKYAILLTALALSACSPKPGATPASSDVASAVTSRPSVSAASVDPATFTGKWTGPEATFLTITPDGAGYKVEVQNLDGPNDFYGAPVADGIQFTRDGTTYIIHPGTGADTGMKWLADKHHCLVVTAGEGYCRD